MVDESEIGQKRKRLNKSSDAAAAGQAGDSDPAEDEVANPTAAKRKRTVDDDEIDD